MGLRPTQCPGPRPACRGQASRVPPAAKAWLPDPLPPPPPGPARLRHVEGPSVPLATSAL